MLKHKFQLFLAFPNFSFSPLKFAIRSSLMIFLLFCSTGTLFSQKSDTTNQENIVIKLVHTKGFKAPKTLKETDMVTVRLKNFDGKIKGQLTLLNDSTIVIDGEEIKIDTIESITVNKPGAYSLGTFLTVVGSGILVGGTGILVIAASSDNFAEQFLGALIACLTMPIGAFIGVSGALILKHGNKRYKMENWHFYVESNT